MATFFMFGRYSTGAAEEANVDRTREVSKFIETMDGQIKGMYAMLGEYDLVLIVELPNMGEAMKVSVGLKRMTGISFFTAAAVPVEEFNQLLGEM